LIKINEAEQEVAIAILKYSSRVAVTKEQQYEGCDVVDYEKCRHRSFPEGCWRDRTPLELAVRLGMVKWPRLDQELGRQCSS
jgi:hypothetical protein